MEGSVELIDGEIISLRYQTFLVFYAPIRNLREIRNEAFCSISA